jgi:hypothetical protein
MRATNTIAGILDEIRTGSGEISLQRLTTVPLEKFFGRTRLHAKTHQTMTGILKVTEIDQAMRFVHAYHGVKDRRLSYGETVAGGECESGLQCEPVVLSGAVLKLADFPVVHRFALSPGHDEGRYVEYLLSDALSLVAKTNLAAMSNKRRRSLYHELQAVASSSRQVLMWLKSAMGTALDVKTSDPIERHIAGLPRKKRVLAEELRMLIGEMGQTVADGVEPLPNLRRATKRAMLECKATNGGDLGEPFTALTANQQTISHARFAKAVRTVRRHKWSFGAGYDCDISHS